MRSFKSFVPCNFNRLLVFNENTFSNGLHHLQFNFLTFHQAHLPDLNAHEVSRSVFLVFDHHIDVSEKILSLISCLLSKFIGYLLFWAFSHVSLAIANESAMQGDKTTIYVANSRKREKIGHTRN